MWDSMKLSRLYSNKPDVFTPIQFLPGLNVVLAEIRLPENRLKDTHNLGKTTLGRVIDFCLLSRPKKDFFLFKHLDLFRDFVFFLEIEVTDGSYVTIRRKVEEHTKISFKRHNQSFKDFSDLPDVSWDHLAVPFDRAKELLDGILDLRDLKPWPYRKIAGYLLRTQKDFGEVFHLGQFAGSHADWKPFLAHLLGFNAQSIDTYYKKEEELTKKESEEDITKKELGGSIEDISKIEGLLLLKQKEAEKKQQLLDGFDFREIDKEKTKTVIDELDIRIGRLNAERYSLSHSKKKIEVSIADDEILFDAKKASELFAEAGVVFAGQIRKDFEQLLSFNRAITEERRGYLKEELIEIEADLERVNAELAELSKRRAEALSFLSSSDVFTKYKRVSDDLVTLKSDIVTLDRQRGFLHRLQDLRAGIRALKEEKNQLQTKIETNVELQNTEKRSRFSVIRVRFSEIVENVIDRKALLSVSPNLQGHLEFRADILDDSGNTTSADLGFTYRKLLCIAFDLALLQAHLGGYYPRFVFHDGVFESWDDRKKENLLEVIRTYTNLGIQHIITLIDSDLPARPNDSEPVFDESEIILRLHDEDDSGRLFKMKSW
jgi:uncharacterized protein YydD (DUF2326 family)